MTPDDIRTQFQNADMVPAEALRAAVAHADTLAPDIYTLADKFCHGVALLPTQENLLFYGLHALAAARHVALYPCLLKLLRQREADLDALFPDHGSISMARLLLSVWDGDADALFHMIEHADLDENSYWALFDVLGRLTFDGRIPRDRTSAFLQRFETTPLADEDDRRWWSWEDAVTRLGLLDLEPALLRVWAKRTNQRQHQRDKDDSLAELRHMAIHPSDPAPFVSCEIMPVDDPADAVAWITRRAEMRERWRREAEAENGPPPADRDPAKDIRLTPEEQHWLERFLLSAHVPDTTLSFDGLDGFFTALVIGPGMVPPSEYLPQLWGTATAEPTWDSFEQAEYVLELLMKHWNAIAARRMAGGPIVPTMELDTSDEICGHLWADGFEVGMAMRDEAWEPLLDNRRIAETVFTVLDLTFDITDANARPINRPRRKQILDQLPTLLQRISDYWKDPTASHPVQRPIRSKKIGRNDPCPCGSGKKYKKCCGGGVTVH